MAALLPEEQEGDVPNQLGAMELLAGFAAGNVSWVCALRGFPSAEQHG